MSFPYTLIKKQAEMVPELDISVFPATIISDGKLADNMLDKMNRVKHTGETYAF